MNDATAPPPPGDLPPSVYRLMSGTLRVGLVLALVLLVSSVAALIVRSPDSSSGSWIAANPLVRYLDLRVLGSGLAARAPEAYLTLGVFALVAVPVVRVVTGMYAFFVHGERRMGLLTTGVLALLLFGLLVLGPLVR